LIQEITQLFSYSISGVENLA